MGFRYIFIGEVSPAQLGITMTGIEFHGHVGPDMEQYKASGSINHTILSIQVETECEDMMTIKNGVEYSFGGMVSALGLSLGTAITLKLTAEVSTSTQLLTGAGIGSISDDWLADFNHIFDAMKVRPEYTHLVMRALTDFREGLLVPHDTGFYCYRSLESITHVHDGKDQKERWLLLGRNLNVHRSYTEWLQSYATEQRHGKTPVMTWDDRKRALEVARVVLIRFCEYLIRNEPLPLTQFPMLQH